METTFKLASRLMMIPAAAACFYCVLRLDEKIFCRLLELVLEQAISIVLCFSELLVSQLDGFATTTVLP